MLAGPRGDRPTRDVCRQYEISEALYYQWRERLLRAAQEAGRRLDAGRFMAVRSPASVREFRRRRLAKVVAQAGESDNEVLPPIPCPLGGEEVEDVPGVDEDAPSGCHSGSCGTQ